MNVFKRSGPEESTAGDPAAARAINRLIEMPRAADEAGLAMVFTGERHFKH